MIIFTGASGEIGSFLIDKFHNEGFEVIGVDVNLPKNQSLVNVRFESVDISNTESLIALWQSIPFDQKITLVNLVGKISNDPLMNFFMGDTSSDFSFAFDESFKTNLFPVVNCTISFAQHAFMNRSNVQVINFGSISSSGIAGQIPYGSAKGAVQFFSRIASVELGAYGVRVNCIVPGYVDSPSLRSRISDDRLEEVLKSSSLRKLVSMEDIFLATKFLHESDSVNGVILEVHSSYGK
jgi:17beta-estradiol 17-dehydrogenase/3alpha(17beta)-hydroxysteroid dehydrogenase (NAD+)